jgi:hypothetical protein
MTRKTSLPVNLKKEYDQFLRSLTTRIYLDINSVKKPRVKSITRSHCWIMVNEKTQLKFVEEA